MLLHPPAPAAPAPFIYPPGSMQRLARGVRTEVQILKLFPRFSTANFKNRLTASKVTSPRRTWARTRTRTPRGSPLRRSPPSGCPGAASSGRCAWRRAGTPDHRGSRTLAYRGPLTLGRPLRSGCFPPTYTHRGPCRDLRVESGPRSRF